MSLVSNEGDGEQNEIRSLQERLESTMNLVKQLSGQLAELKEQVSSLVISFYSLAVCVNSCLQARKFSLSIGSQLGHSSEMNFCHWEVLFQMQRKLIN